MKNVEVRAERFHGFSVTELIVVIAIVATLAALMVPGLSRVRKQAVNTQCANNLRSLTQAGVLYIGEHNGALPATYLVGSGNTNNKYYFDGLAAYLDLKLNSAGQPYELSEVFRCPAASNWRKGNQPRSWTNVSYVTVATTPYDNPRVVSIVPAKSVALLDCESPGVRYGIEAQSQFDTAVPASGANPWRHKNGVNASYWDGHVEYIDHPTYNDIKPVSAQ